MKSLKKILGWLFFTFFTIIGLALLENSKVSALSMVVVGLIVLPPLLPFIKQKFNRSFSTKIKASTIVGLVVLMSAAFDQSKVQQTTANQNTKQEKIVETIKESSSELTPNQEIQPTIQYYKVVNVVDGDTIDLLIDGKSQRLRLIGIDTPETVDPRNPVQCFGIEASNKAKGLLTGQEVSLEDDPTQDNLDKYDRLLRYVFLKDGTFFNKLMITEGYAHEYTYDTPYKYQQEFKDAEKQASESKVGLWADNACPIPTPAPIVVPKPTVIIPTVPAQKVSPTVNTPTANTQNTYRCDCSKTCTQISSCSEAQYLLNSCGCKARDADKDGIACDGAPLHCQN